jgi:hypothetical protein
MSRVFFFIDIFSQPNTKLIEQGLCSTLSRAQRKKLLTYAHTVIQYDQIAFNFSDSFRKRGLLRFVAKSQASYRTCLLSLFIFITSSVLKIKLYRIKFMFAVSFLDVRAQVGILTEVE